MFSPAVRELDVLYNAKRFVVSSVGGATRFGNLRWKFSKTQKSAAESCQILRTVSSEIMINFPHDVEHFALHPADMHCPAWDDAFGF